VGDPDSVEVTCDREGCGLVHVIHRNELRLVLGAVCPECGQGRIVLAPQPDRHEDASGRGRGVTRPSRSAAPWYR
jgi:hypothetical protein